MKLFNLPRLDYNPIDVNGQALEDMWLDWIQLEVKKRYIGPRKKGKEAKLKAYQGLLWP